MLHFVGAASFGHRDVGRQTARAEPGQIDPHRLVPFHPQVFGHSRGSLQFKPMPLAVIDRQGEQPKTIGLGDRAGGGGI